MGWVEDNEIVCAYHGFRYRGDGRCTRVPAQPDAAIPTKLCMQVFQSEIRYGLVWTCLAPHPRVPIPEWPEHHVDGLHHIQLPP
ncbi:MAG: Rieske 2Fe-2S domain-containing protein [Candidatus Synoicihabitans palmerolidicus]|nr:Rieske 2Fe-2S domain-containing protein [Candidatus Synoicihabitans palmerolidicus]